MRVFFALEVWRGLFWNSMVLLQPLKIVAMQLFSKLHMTCLYQ